MEIKPGSQRVKGNQAARHPDRLIAEIHPATGNNVHLKWERSVKKWRDGSRVNYKGRSLAACPLLNYKEGNRESNTEGSKGTMQQIQSQNKSVTV